MAPSTTEIYTLSLHDALPISHLPQRPDAGYIPNHHAQGNDRGVRRQLQPTRPAPPRHRSGACQPVRWRGRSEEHTSELQSLAYLVCRLLLEKKKSIML